MALTGPIDLAIVGGGVIGLTAAHLALERHPRWRIALFDQDLAGSGASLYSAGFGLPWGRSPDHCRVSAVGAREWRRLQGRWPELPLHTLPWYAVVPEEKALAWSDQVAAARGLGGRREAPAPGGDEAAWGHEPPVAPAGPGDRERLEALYGPLALGEGDTLLDAGPAFRGEVHGVCRVLAGHLRRDPRCTLLEATRVHGLAGGPGERRLELGGGGRDGARTVLARRVLLTVGPWALAGPEAEEVRGLGVRIKKVAALHLDLPGGDLPGGRAALDAGTPALSLVAGDAFLLPLPERGEVLLSFASEEWDVPPDPARLALTGDDLHRARTVLEAHCPAMADRIRGGRVFCDAYGPDRLYRVAPLAEEGDLVTAGAASGSGFRLAPGLALEALALLESAP